MYYQGKCGRQQPTSNYHTVDSSLFQHEHSCRSCHDTPSSWTAIHQQSLQVLHRHNHQRIKQVISTTIIVQSNFHFLKSIYWTQELLPMDVWYHLKQKYNPKLISYSDLQQSRQSPVVPSHLLLIHIAMSLANTFSQPSDTLTTYNDIR